jgi:CDP-glycerol glycerophosphotransferase
MSDPAAMDVSRVDDMYEILAGCDAFMTDYSSAAFDAAVMRIPIFLYCDDYQEYEVERGKLLWDLRKLPFPLAEDNGELVQRIRDFDEDAYRTALDKLSEETGVVEDGAASGKVVELIRRM